MTVRDLITQSLRKLGVIASGEVPSADEMSDTFEALQHLIGSWSTERLLTPRRIREEFAFIANQQAYTMGAGGDFNTVRPMAIEKASIEVQGSSPLELPVKIWNEDEWARENNKELASTYPLKIFVEESYPLMTIHVWPVPASSLEKLVLYSWKPLTNFDSVDDDVELPQGWSRALIYNLALEVAPEYEMEPSPSMVAIALESKANIKRMNKKPLLMIVDSALIKSGGFDWRTGE